MADAQFAIQPPRRTAKGQVIKPRVVVKVDIGGFPATPRSFILVTITLHLAASRNWVNDIHGGSDSEGDGFTPNSNILNRPVVKRPGYFDNVLYFVFDNLTPTHTGTFVLKASFMVNGYQATNAVWSDEFEVVEEDTVLPPLTEDEVFIVESLGNDKVVPYDLSAW